MFDVQNTLLSHVSGGITPFFRLKHPPVPPGPR